MYQLSYIIFSIPLHYETFLFFKKREKNDGEKFKYLLFPFLKVKKGDNMGQYLVSLSKSSFERLISVSKIADNINDAHIYVVYNEETGMYDVYASKWYRPWVCSALLKFFGHDVQIHIPQLHIYIVER